MSYTSDLLDGIAQLLEDQAVGVYTSTAVIEGPATGIFRGSMPATPDRAIAINAYPVEDTDLTDTITGVQIRVRAGRDPAAIDDLSDAVFEVLHNRDSYRLNGIWVALSYRQSQAWIGMDTHGRMELTANYYFRTTRAGSHLID